MTAVRSNRLWTAPFVLVSVLHLFVMVVYILLMTTLAVYAIRTFAVSEAAGGLTASVFVIGATAARLGAGTLVDVVGRRPVLLASATLVVLACVAYLLVDDLVPLLAVRVVHGLAFGTATTATNAVAQSLIPEERRAEGTGYFGMWAALATAIGPTLGLLLVDGPGYTALFVTATLLSAAAAVGAAFLRVEESGERSGVHGLRRVRPAHLVHRDVVPVSTVILIAGAAYGCVLTYADAFAREHDLPAGAGVMFTAYAVTLVASRPLMGRWQDRVGDNPVVRTTMVAFAAGLLALAVSGGFLGFAVAGVLLGLGFGTQLAALQAAAIRLTSPARVGVAVSTYFFMLDLGLGVGPLLAGLLATVVGLGPMFALLGGVVAAGAVLYERVHGRHAAARRRVRDGAQSLVTGE